MNSTLLQPFRGGSGLSNGVVELVDGGSQLEVDGIAVVDENKDILVVLDVLRLLLDGGRAHPLPSMLLLVFKNVSDPNESVSAGYCYRGLVASVCLLLILVFDLCVNDIEWVSP
jgi:hypothetical protein